MTIFHSIFVPDIFYPDNDLRARELTTGLEWNKSVDSLERQFLWALRGHVLYPPSKSPTPLLADVELEALVGRWHTSL